MEKTVTLVLVTPAGAEFRVICDSLRLEVPDGQPVGLLHKSSPGGSVGIRYGHLDALFAVAAGKVTAYLAGQLIWSAQVGTGLASVSGGDTVSLLVETVDVLDLTDEK